MKMDYKEIENLLNATINDKNPLQFIDDVTIKKMKFIRNTKYVYYEIYNNDKKISYYGIIDIILNKVIFNTNETIIKFMPYSSNSMLAITEESAYRICAISDGNTCINSCDNNNILINNYKPNVCGNSCEIISFILFPNNICIEDKDCDESIYYKNNKNECGLCKDIGEGRDYKLINSTGCHQNECPTNSYEYNKDYHLCICDNGHELKDGQCLPVDTKCYKFCKGCKEFSDNINDQKCIECDPSYDLLFEDGNCVEKCSKGKYASLENKCENCSESCVTCEKDKNNCTSCNLKEYLTKENQCLPCSEECYSCSENNKNCLSCDNSSKYKYFFESNHTCVEKCPNGTILKENKCININETNNEDGEDNSNKEDYMFWIFIILIFILLLIISLILWKRYYNKKDDSHLIEQINISEDKEIIN